MKVTLYNTIFLLFLTLICEAQIPTPPGTIQIGPNLYYDQSEISNAEYQNFLDHIKKDSSEDYYIKCIPNKSLIISKYVKIDESYYTNEIYFRNKKTRHNPVVGISYEQATDFCKWRTEILSRKLAKNGELDLNTYSLQFRLPTLEEWIKIALANDYDFAETAQKLRNVNNATMSRKTLSKIAKENDLNLSGKEYEMVFIEYLKLHPIHYMENLAYKGDDKRLIKAVNYDFPRSVASYYPENPLIYDLRGNVSEMTATKGIAKGGNWQSAEGEISVWDNVKYDKPSALIGFRCICEVKKLSE